MSQAFRVGVLVGSLRSGSHTRKIAQALMSLAPPTLQCTAIDIQELPVFNEDLEGRVEAWERLRASVKDCDAVLLVTPEYNRSVPGCLKNALDVGSRPQGRNVWDGKPTAVVSVTPYKLGAFGANHAVRQALVYLNMLVMQQPEAYIGNAASLFDEAGKLKDQDAAELLKKFMAAFGDWIHRLLPTPGAGDARGASDFEGFMQRRMQAAAAYVNGDAGPVDRMAVTRGSATFFPPNGGAVSGAEEVAARYRSDAKSFAPGGSSQLEVLQSADSGSVAFWSGFQEATARLNGKEMKMKLRVTEVFRAVEGEWKLIHRHAAQA
jgi:NAD(P)H-dependent FMN reductase/ketosteroid isomerase-like protein